MIRLLNESGNNLSMGIRWMVVFLAFCTAFLVVRWATLEGRPSAGVDAVAGTEAGAGAGIRREGPNDTACVLTPSPPSFTGEWIRVPGAEGNDNEPVCDCCGMSRPIPGIDDSLHSGGGDSNDSEPRGCRCASSNAVGTLIRYALELPGDPDT